MTYDHEDRRHMQRVQMAELSGGRNMSSCTCEAAPGMAHSLTCPKSKPDVAKELKPLGLCDPPDNPFPLPGETFRLRYRVGNNTVPAVGRDIANAREVGEAMQNFLSSHVAMALFSKLTLYRASGENPRVFVTYVKGKEGPRFRVSLQRSNGEVEHFNRDGQS